MKNEITVQRAWVEGLLKYANEAKEYMDANSDNENFDFRFASLIGFAQSAESLLK